jgi:hypothetical protein
LYQVEEENEPHLLVLSVLRGAVGDGGATVSCSWWFTEKRERRREEMAAARWEEWGGARFWGAKPRQL